MSGFRLRLLGSLREPNVRIKDETEYRHCSAYLAWDEMVPAPFAWIAPRAECPDQTGDRGQNIVGQKNGFLVPSLLAPSSLTNGSYACPRSPKFSNFIKSWQKAVFFIEIDLLRKNERWHCVIKVKGKRSHACLFYVFVPFYLFFFLSVTCFVKYSIRYKPLRQCSGSESVCFWASRIWIRNYFYGSGSFHQQASKLR